MANTKIRLRNDESITLGRLDQVMKRLKVTLWDMFGMAGNEIADGDFGTERTG